MTPLSVIIDTDPGVDDALAILLALRSPELNVLAITTVGGNVPLVQTTQNALLLLELAERSDVPVFVGEDATAHVCLHAQSDSTDLPPSAADVHGGDGIGGITLLCDDRGGRRYRSAAGQPLPDPASTAIPHIARSRPGEVTLIALGPLTNVAAALASDMEGMRLLREIVVMGGAFRCPGNITPVAEFNIFMDPQAAQQLLNSGIRVRFVPLDVTEQVLLRPAHLAPPIADPGSSPYSSKFLQLLLGHTFEFYADRIGYLGCHLHDPLAVAAAFSPQLFGFRSASVQVVCEPGHAFGMTIGDFRERRIAPVPNCSFAQSVDVNAARELVLERLITP